MSSGNYKAPFFVSLKIMITQSFSRNEDKVDKTGNASVLVWVSISLSDRSNLKKRSSLPCQSSKHAITEITQA
ncbi:hypothetical protein T4B_239 [Trichinella pseudospiralis]|uniref:Uncharacterized protein n=2 Tax=Trichinella pseudospiralis TaxID=6337 RepID=A0A0V1JVJ7_TRIPS|nr:hypothetical protein T4A_217 [Trichinella pseudospiralis]KRY80887.1 hypothetical protein T4D_1926 [Trichinella pseudospiralis]KRY85636.1 hypothetical protein T4D_1872 [Trichinella pseudospiralis]KRZ04284.1 hypothetical protein T4B_9221 [Trichinella pseudospiralis]KRZ23104.1 hypothetical protein T4B_239 [Trichinella pseudospiralis]